MFYILETQQTIQINSLETFTIELPSKGKYQFEFYSDQVNALTYYPTKITTRKNTVTIRLRTKTKTIKAPTTGRSFPLIDISDFSEEQLEEGINNGSINFIFHGLITLSPEAIKPFKEAFGVGFISENCVVDPVSFRIAMSTNKKIENYLNLKFGEVWKEQLPAQPFGLQSL